MTDFEKWASGYHAGMLNDPDDSARFARAAACDAWQAALPKWQPADTAPENKHVLACFEDERGNKTIVKAVLRGRFFEEAGEGWLDSDYVDYCEETDTHYCPAGWYEVWKSHPDWGCYWMNGDKPTHWMPLPEVPGD